MVDGGYHQKPPNAVRLSELSLRAAMARFAELDLHTRPES